MKWFQLASLLAPAIGLAIPGAAPLIPIIISAVNHAQQVHGDTNNAAKRALVKDATDLAVATGKVKIDPVTADKATDAVFDAIDSVHAIVKANQ